MNAISNLKLSKETELSLPPPRPIATPINNKSANTIGSKANKLQINVLETPSLYANQKLDIDNNLSGEPKYGNFYTPNKNSRNNNIELQESVPKRETYSRIHKFVPDDISANLFKSGKKLLKVQNPETFISAYKYIKDRHTIKNLKLRTDK